MREIGKSGEWNVCGECWLEEKICYVTVVNLYMNGMMTGIMNSRVLGRGMKRTK